MRPLLVLTLVCVVAATAQAQLPDIKTPSVPSGPKPPAGVPGASRPGGGCGDISGSKVGARLQAFLVATKELDRASAELEGSVKAACTRMAKELGTVTQGNTKTICNSVAAELKKSLRASVKANAKVQTKYTPAVCTVKADYAAELAAKCEGKAKADVKVKCEGTCSGTCTGACKGACSQKNAQGQCAGTCEGTCGGTCSGSCKGSANVDGSAECKASAQARANLKAECTEPKVEVVYDASVVVDAPRFEKSKRAIMAGLPALLMVGAKAKVLQKSAVLWGQTAAKLAKSGATLAKDLGAAGMCVAGELAASAKAATQVNARVSVSIQASASVSGSASGSAK